MAVQARSQSSITGPQGPFQLKKAALAVACLSALTSGAALAATTVEAERMGRTGGYAADGSLAKVSSGSSGTLTQRFTGATGTYNIAVHVELESDGRPNLKVYKGSSLLSNYTYPAGANGSARSFTINNVALASGDTLKLVGTVNGGALARVDKMVLTQVSAPKPSPAPAPSGPVTMEAERMTRSGGYVADGSLIKVGTGSSGTATQNFPGSTGTYNALVHVELESDGRPNLKVYKGNTLISNYTYPTAANGSAGVFSINNVALKAGEAIRLVGTINGGAHARVDKLVFSPAGAAPAPTPTPEPTPEPDTGSKPSLPSTGTRAVPTFESLGLYWTPPSNPGAAGCTVQYREAGQSTWQTGLPMWYDARNKECRGSVVQLKPGTNYEVQFAMPGKAASAALTAKTWSEKFPIARTVHVSNTSAPLNITQGGTASGYVLYTAAPGTTATIDVANKAAANITISAPYVIIRGLTLKGATQDVIRLNSGARDIVVEDNDMSGWGRYRSTNSAGWQLGMDGDAAVRCERVSTLDRVIIQRNRIHDPRYGSNSWSTGHPSGPQGVTFNSCGGNHVIRHNEIYSSAKHYFNDAIGGGDNFSDKGFPNFDSDIYGNKISHVWDDAIEAEGGNRNVRIWGNYMDQTATGVATTATHHGPVYIFRNVYNRSRQLSEKVPDQDDRNAFAKSGTRTEFGNGRRYVFHNTLLQAPPAKGSTLTSGAGIGLYGPSADQKLTNTVSRNNIWHIWKPHWQSIDERGGTGNDLNYDLFNGNVTALRAEVNGLVGTPIYASGNGWSSEANGMYQLAPNSPGYDRGAVLPNFNDGYKGSKPDIGAHEAGSPPMKFGPQAGSKAY
jgi:hypothetical protein